MNTNGDFMELRHVYIFSNGLLAGIIVVAMIAVIIFAYHRRK